MWMEGDSREVARSPWNPAPRGALPPPAQASPSPTHRDHGPGKGGAALLQLILHPWGETAPLPAPQEGSAHFQVWWAGSRGRRPPRMAVLLDTQGLGGGGRGRGRGYRRECKGTEWLRGEGTPRAPRGAQGASQM